MALLAERPSVGEMLADALDVHDPVVLTLIAELETEGATARQANLLALKLGFRNRFDLAHRLRQSKLPCLTELRACLRVLNWVRAWETERVSLARQALRKGHDPAVWYRTVKHVTGRCWSEVRGNGTQHLVWNLRQRRGGSET